MVFVTILSIRIASNGCRKRPTQRSVRARHRYSNFVGGWIVDTLQRAIMMSVFPTKAAMEKTKFVLERNIDNPGVNVLVWFTMVCSSLQLTVLQFSYTRSVICAVRKSWKIPLGWHLFTGLIAETFTYTPINTQNYVYHMDAPASIPSECLVLLWYVRYSWPSSKRAENRYDFSYPSKSSRDCLAGKQKYGRRRQDAPRVILFNTHLALFWQKKTYLVHKFIFKTKCI